MGRAGVADVGAEGAFADVFVPTAGGITSCSFVLVRARSLDLMRDDRLLCT